jgi:hypothetical protein
MLCADSRALTHSVSSACKLESTARRSTEPHAIAERRPKPDAIAERRPESDANAGRNPHCESAAEFRCKFTAESKRELNAKVVA